MPELILPLCYFPSIDYFALVAQNSTVLLEKHESYPRQTLRNRCVIYGANGAMNISIPITHTGEKRYAEMEIDYSTNWQHQHWHALVSSYKNTPFFEHYAPFFEHFFKQKTTKLFDYNLNIYKVLLKCLNLDQNILFTTEFQKNYPNTLDLRLFFKPSKNPQLFQQKPYFQAFSDKNGFIANCSILDLLFHEGTQAKAYLNAVSLETFL